MRSIHVQWLLAIALLSGSFSITVTIQAAESKTNAPTVRPPPADQSPPPKLQDLAAAHERAGRKREAATLYEEMARTNATARKVLSHRLVALYTETGETNKALSWAREVMRTNPDPQAYLAGVHARLGQWKEAENILTQEIAKNTNTTRAVTLRWQLAEVHVQEGEPAKARDVLTDAGSLSKGTPMEGATQRRLQGLHGGKK